MATIYLAHIILSLPVGFYHIKIGSPGEPAATTMSQTGCYMDVSLLMCLLQKMYNYMNLFRVTGCTYILRDKTQKTPVEETIDKIGAILETVPWKQVVQIAQQMGMSASSVHSATTLLHVHPPDICGP